jgi:hypothetical protein
LTTEAWVAVCIAGGLAALLARPEPPSDWQWAVAGVLVGAAALFKQTGLATLAAFGGWAFLQAGSWRLLARRWLWLLAGCALPIGLTIAYFAAHGALDDLWRDAIWINLTSYPRLSYGTLLRGNLVNLRGFPLMWLGVALAVVFARPRFRRTERPDPAALLWLTLLAGVLPLLHRSYGHYVLQALPPATILAGVGLAATARWLGRAVAGEGKQTSPWRRHASNVVLALALAGAIALALVDLPRWPRYLAYTGDLVRTQARAAAAITAASAPGESILVVSDSPQLYFLSDRPPASRLQYLLPVNHNATGEAELARLIQQRAVNIIAVDEQVFAWHARLARAVADACTLFDSYGERFWLYRCRPQD